MSGWEDDPGNGGKWKESHQQREPWAKRAGHGGMTTIMNNILEIAGFFGAQGSF